jgi:hypothetical protein
MQEAIRRHAFQRAFAAPVEITAIEEFRASLESASKQDVPDVRGWGAAGEPGAPEGTPENTKDIENPLAEEDPRL